MRTLCWVVRRRGGRGLSAEFHWNAAEGGGGVRRELFSTRASPVIKRGCECACVWGRLFDCSSFIYVDRWVLVAETSDEPRPLSLSFSLFFRSQSRRARRNWKRPRAKVTLFNVVSSKKYLSLFLWLVFFFFRLWNVRQVERGGSFLGCSLGKCCLPPSSCRHRESDRRFAGLSRWILFFGRYIHWIFVKKL